MCEVLNYYLSNESLRLNYVNDQIRHFDFGHRSNRPPDIKENNITRGDLDYSASGMLNFLFFGCLVDFIISNDCGV